MPLEVIGGDVEQYRDVEGERGDQLQLKRAGFEHIGAVAAERHQRQRRGAEIAADLDPPFGGSQDVAEQRRRRRFAVGAGDADIASRGLRPAEQFDVADDLDTGRAGMHHRRMRRGKAVRDPWRQDEGGDMPPVDVR